MAVTDADGRIEVIFRDECVRLLGTEEVGRIGFANRGQVDVLPVNYALDGDAVVFATAPGSKLWAAENGSVTFEVDHVEEATRSGWSVVVHGFAQEITSRDAPGLLERLRALEVHPWAGGTRPHLVRIAPRTMTGRRVGSPPPAGEPPTSTLQALDDEECVRLLRSHRLGRIAFAHRSWPVILPVNYVYDDPSVVIRTGPGAKLDSAPLTGVAFEIDDADPDGAWGWSVVVQGPAFDITEAADTYSQRLRLAPVVPWPEGARVHWLKISAVHLSGRRFGAVPRGPGS